MIEIFCPKDVTLTDAQILSFWEMMFAPAQVKWDYEDTSTSAQKSPDQVLHFVRETLIPRMDGLACWARENDVVVGMASLNRRTEPAYARRIDALDHAADLSPVRRVLGQDQIADRRRAVVLARFRRQAWVAVHVFYEFGACGK